MLRYCAFCDKKVEVKPIEKEMHVNIDDMDVVYKGIELRCPCCGEPVYDSKINDANIAAANAAYRSMSNIISLDEINEILERYDIGKKPLAQLLGWGEATLLRYFDGFTPKRDYSDCLKELLNPYKMLQVLNANGTVLSDVARRKTMDKVNAFINEKGNDDKAFGVVNFFLANIDVENEETITHMKLQKLLYYVQAWSLALLHHVMFTDRIEAWAHGPVIPNVYQTFKVFGREPIAAIEQWDDSSFNDEEKNVLRIVKKIYGNFDAPVLRKFTHSEDPWIKARHGLPDNENSNNEISNNDMRAFYCGKGKSYEEIKEYVLQMHASTMGITFN